MSPSDESLPEVAAANYSDQVLVQLSKSDLRRLKHRLTTAELPAEIQKSLESCAQENRFSVGALKKILDCNNGIADFYGDQPIHVHELVERGRVMIPTTPPDPEPSAEYKEKMERLRREAENREYAKMTKGVDLCGMTNQNKEPSLRQEMQSVNRQLTAVLNTILTTAGAFMFGYAGLPMFVPGYNLELAVRVALGLTFATCVFFADLYFLAKTL